MSRSSEKQSLPHLHRRERCGQRTLSSRHEQGGDLEKRAAMIFCFLIFSSHLYVFVLVQVDVFLKDDGESNYK